MKKNLTFHYALYQLLYFSITAGTGGFAATYLLSKGFSTARIGVILAVTNIASCALQPLLGVAVDRARRFVLPGLLSLLGGIAVLCFAGLSFLTIGQSVQGVLYVLGGLMLVVMPSLSNALCAYYTQRSYVIRFGVGAGIGSLAYSAASLGIGYLIAWQGADRMIHLVLCLLLILIVLVLLYPKTEDTSNVTTGEPEITQSQTSLIGFTWKYRAFCITIFGVMLIAMTHAMTENYLINLFEPLGGGSENVGMALFIACLSAVPFLMFFDSVQERVSVSVLMRLAGLFYMLKAFCFLQASSVMQVYLTVLVQFCSYGFLFPSLYYYAKAQIPKQDMAKGQTLAMSMYTLGLALGSLAGGQLLNTLGLKPMLIGAMLTSGIGAGIVNLSISGKRKHN